MARIRSIKPEFWTSAQVLECSQNARLLFIGLWNFCDDAGRHPDSAKQLKAEVFPADEISLDTVRGLVDEWIKNDLVTRYKVRGVSYLQVKGWHHQRIDKPQKPRYPGPDEADSESIPRTIDEPSRLIRSDTIGKDTIGKDLKRAAAPLRAENAEDANFELFKSAYPERSGDQRWVGARKAINARLAEGHTWTEILEGTRRYAEWCRATTKIGTETVKQAASFVGTEKCFLLPWNPPLSKADARLGANLSAADEFLRRTEARA